MNALPRKVQCLIALMLLVMALMPVQYAGVEAAPHAKAGHGGQRTVAPSSLSSQANIPSWMKEAWLPAKDHPFIVVRHEIEGALARGVKPDVLLAKCYQAPVSSNVIDVDGVLSQPPVAATPSAIDVYRWGLAFFYTHLYDTQYQYTPGALALAAALNATPPQRSAEYARMRFLAETVLTEEPPLKICGRRLLRRYPADFQVEHMLIRYLALSRNDADEHDALTYANNWVKASPKNEHALRALANAWSWRLGFHETRSNLEGAIHAWESYRSVVPADSMGHGTAEAVLKVLAKYKIK